MGSVSSWICWFLLRSGRGSGACLPSSFFSQEKVSVPSWISWFLLLRAGVPVLVSLLRFVSRAAVSLWSDVTWACAGAIVLKRKQLVPVLDLSEN